MAFFLRCAHVLLLVNFYDWFFSSIERRVFFVFRLFPNLFFMDLGDRAKKTFYEWSGVEHRKKNSISQSPRHDWEAKWIVVLNKREQIRCDGANFIIAPVIDLSGAWALTWHFFFSSKTDYRRFNVFFFGARQHVLWKRIVMWCVVFCGEW